MSLFDSLGTFGETTAVIDSSGRKYSYKELDAATDELAARMGSERKKLVLILSGNNIETLTAYLAAIKSAHAALLIDAGTDPAFIDNIAAIYRPDLLWRPAATGDAGTQAGSYELRETEGEASQSLCHDLALLLTTSGTTGSPKLVRLTRRNLQANASSIAGYLKLDQRQRPITVLPMHYSYGLSVINSHLLVGATILLTGDSVMSRPFWDFFRTAGATSLAGVPYTYEILKRLNFLRMDLPSLRCLTQAGGRLSPTLVSEFGRYARDRVDFFVMYGQTEATARISYLPPEKTLEKSNSIGVAIPGGSLGVVDPLGEEVNEPFREGELVYRGDNVMMGYANSRDDLAKGDELGGVLLTGDIGYFDEERYFYISGRKKRFLKIFGNRVSLDDIEAYLRDEGVACACSGKDDLLCIAVKKGDVPALVQRKVADKFGIHPSVVDMREVDEIPLTAAGKVHYARIFGEAPA